MEVLLKHLQKEKKRKRMSLLPPPPYLALARLTVVKQMTNRLWKTDIKSYSYSTPSVLSCGAQHYCHSFSYTIRHDY